MAASHTTASVERKLHSSYRGTAAATLSMYGTTSTPTEPPLASFLASAVASAAAAAPSPPTPWRHVCKIQHLGLARVMLVSCWCWCHTQCLGSRLSAGGKGKPGSLHTYRGHVCHVGCAQTRAGHGRKGLLVAARAGLEAGAMAGRNLCHNWCRGRPKGCNNAAQKTSWTYGEAV